jgi:hypothetical protein
LKAKLDEYFNGSESKKAKEIERIRRQKQRRERRLTKPAEEPINTPV